MSLTTQQVENDFQEYLSKFNWQAYGYGAVSKVISGVKSSQVIAGLNYLNSTDYIVYPDFDVATDMWTQIGNMPSNSSRFTVFPSTLQGKNYNPAAAKVQLAIKYDQTGDRNPDFGSMLIDPLFLYAMVMMSLRTDYLRRISDDNSIVVNLVQLVLPANMNPGRFIGQVRYGGIIDSMANMLKTVAPLSQNSLTVKAFMQTQTQSKGLVSFLSLTNSLSSLQKKSYRLTHVGLEQGVLIKKIVKTLYL